MNLFSDTIVQIALPVPIRKTFDYLPPVDTNEPIKTGQRVLVPFGRQTLIGIVQSIKADTEHNYDKLKSIIKVIDQFETIDDHQHRLITWAAQYFHHPIGEVYSAAVPASLRENKELEELKEKVLRATTMLPEAGEISLRAKLQIELAKLLNKSELDKAQLAQSNVSSTTIKTFIDKGWAQWVDKPLTPVEFTANLVNDELQLNTEQAVAVSAINAAEGQSTFLLEGITGSGKTEVYLQAISHVLSKQQQVLVLVPEIGLTPQTVERFQKRFDVPIGLLHSGMTDKQRLATWIKARAGVLKIVIATRSGVFLPFDNLGMIVIDEEHDASFKQQEGFKYHCRSLALYRAKLLDIPVVLGSATPALETLQNALNGRFHHLQLKQRAAGSGLPQIKLLDLNICQQDASLGDPLITRVEQVIAQKQQVMLFINRRGFAPVLMCEECHWLTECPRCSSYTTYHKKNNRLICHHCGFQTPPPSQCGGCGSTRVTTVGVGTEQIELTLQQRFPNTTVVRLDRDSTSKKGEFEQKLEQIHAGEPMIIIGTQMIAKGHHFPNVSLVGIVDVDGALFSTDFRAPEKLAQLVVQISGRAGRGSNKGEVWLQTKFPEHPVIQDLVNNQYQDFAKFALTERQNLHLPPFSHQVILRAEATQDYFASQWLQSVAQHLTQFEHLMVLGPAPAPMMRKAGKYRQLLTVQCNSRPYLQNILKWLMENLDSIEKDNRIRWSVDVDPLDLS